MVKKEMRRVPIGAAGLFLLLLALACTYSAGGNSNDGPGAGGDDSLPQATAASSGSSSISGVVAPAPNAGGPAVGTVELSEAPVGRACFGSGGAGIVCLTEAGAWQHYDRDNSGLTGNRVSAMAVCPDNTILAAHTSGVDALQGESWISYGDGWDGGSADAIACAADGSFWVAHFRGVSHFDGVGWTTYPASELATGPDATDLVEDVAIAADGTVWVTTASSVAAFAGGSWTLYQDGTGFEGRPFPDVVAIDSAGRTWISNSGGLSVLVDGSWAEYDSPDIVSFESMDVGFGDQIWLGTLSDGVIVFNGSSWASYRPGANGPGSGHVRDLTIDAQGRIWLASSYGVTVYDGANWQTYQMHTADLPENDFLSVAVVAGGPALPAPTAPALGTLAGQLLFEDETPIAGVRVEVCVENLGSLYFGDTPCSDQPFFLQTTTDSAGRFAFPELPVGLYSVTADPGDGQWAQFTGDFGLSEQVPVLAGEVTDVGELYLTVEE